MTVTRLPRPVYSSYEWQEQGLCRGKDAEQFFVDDPDMGQVRRREQTEAAKAVCHDCPVARACLEHAMAVPETFGIWGGMTASERGRLRWDVAG